MEFDYIVAGGGTAGCLLANRLSADPACRVLLLEAGARPRGFWTRAPAGTAKMFNPGPYNWGFETEPEPHLDQRRIYAPRGKALGGSSLINGMVYVRGQAADFDRWSKFGVQGWDWKDVLPYYKKLERASTGSDEWRGRQGELTVGGPLYEHPASADFVTACERAGIPANPDFNGASAEGAGFLQFSIDQGWRHSSAEAFLFPIQKRRNLCVMTGCHVARVITQGGQATGVEFIRGGARQVARASREVLLCGGAIGSPAILLHSGIGPGQQLQALGIAAVAELSGVGANLQDHFYVHCNFSATESSSLNQQLRGWRALRHGMHFLLARRGPLTMGASQSAAFVRALPGPGRADTQINFKPVTWARTPTGVVISRQPEMNASSCFLHPHSRGQVSLRSADPLQPPVIQANYLSAEVDRAAVLASIRLVRKIFALAPMSERVLSEVAPGPQRQSDDELMAYVREFGASMHHWAGSCRMGTDAQAVVDGKLRVHGVGKLRVIDASVIPLMPSANTNAATYVVAERAAALIAEDAAPRV